jgi:hypothetical protein
VFKPYLYHLDAMEDPAHPNYPRDLLNTVGPHKCTLDAGTLYPKRMETVDDERFATCPSISSTRPMVAGLNATV